MQSISFLYNDVSIRIKNARKIKTFIPQIFKKEKVKLAQMNYIFSTDEFVLDINRRFLHHDFYTDIITFPLSQKDQPVQGEIYISVQRVKENAKTYHSTIENEMLRIIIHGALHLCGHGDKTKKEKLAMTQKENEYIAMFKIDPRKSSK